MDLTEGTIEQKTGRAKKMMLWFGIVSLLMTFAGWTSAYIVSSTREDWLTDFQLPGIFFISTGVLILSSLTFILAKMAMRGNKSSLCTSFLITTLVLGVIFILLQFRGFSEIVAQGFYFTGESSSVTTSYIFLIAMVHILHVVAGLISLLVVITNQLKGKYSPENLLGIELGATFWHFLDLLWVYLMLFFYFFK
ncbi:cytochrome c oxidase subunit 3 [Cellulophaga sp. E16_2]|uniref:Cytochrome c oxidase subunit III n=1 Tax=Cellulophaga algicola (strain DSM 14237 / IC166 / ACAM 630) TaxID=688270 RepID=E6X4Q2_CELAD|nr:MULTISPECIES: cytochrome c oxidase subunit 3 [Cellulophaga]ADV49377.1 cytochrome c oxidase subunit III [Cellulophaga algicola DSM 14237]MBO0591830.1 cytochrome c oxidase subunit 3 [Cellulophaga sp. E16_2]